MVVNIHLSFTNNSMYPNCSRNLCLPIPFFTLFENKRLPERYVNDQIAVYVELHLSKTSTSKYPFVKSCIFFPLSIDRLLLNRSVITLYVFSQFLQMKKQTLSLSWYSLDNNKIGSWCNIFRPKPVDIGYLV